MALHDFRTKPETEWTYYVVDDLATFNDVYQFDTPEQAIEKFKEIPEEKKSAIGASINGSNELDLIHRSMEGPPVLVTDFLKPNMGSEWQGKEIQDAIDLMIAHLSIEWQLESNLFGVMRPSVAIPLERYTDQHLDEYFKDKLLLADRPNISQLSAISEVYAQKEGWVPILGFLDKLEDCSPSAPGKHSGIMYVDRVNVQYVSDSLHTGQADMSPREFKAFQTQTKERMDPMHFAQELLRLSETYPQNKLWRDHKDAKEDQLQALTDEVKNRFEGQLTTSYSIYLHNCLKDTDMSYEQMKSIHTLQAILLAGTDKANRKDMLRPPLDSQIHCAQAEANKDLQNKQLPEKGRGEDR